MRCPECGREGGHFRRCSTLTDHQVKFLDFICAYLLREHCQPTIRDLGVQFGIVSPNGVMCHIKALEKKGYLMRPGGARHLVILRGSDRRPFTLCRKEDLCLSFPANQASESSSPCPRDTSRCGSTRSGTER